MLVTAGNGFYQENGQAARAIRKGDIVVIPATIEHWHGASADSHFTHIAITNFKVDASVEWLLPVTDSEYNSVTKNYK